MAADVMLEQLNIFLGVLNAEFKRVDVKMKFVFNPYKK